MNYLITMETNQEARCSKSCRISDSWNIQNLRIISKCNVGSPEVQILDS